MIRDRATVETRATAFVAPAVLVWCALIAISGLAYADVSADAVRALGICSADDFADPRSPCYGLGEDSAEPGVRGTFRQAERSGGGESEVACANGVFVVTIGYLSQSVARLGEQCGWRVFWNARRGERKLDWKVVVPYSIRYSSFGTAVEGVLQPYGASVGADIYPDARVIDVKVHEDR